MKVSNMNAQMLVACLLLSGSALAAVDGDGDYDLNDIQVILDGLGETATADDPRDLDGDGTITVLDARIAAVRCSRAACSTDNEPPTTSDVTVSLDENAAIGTAVATVVGNDTDAGQSLSYAITSGNGAGGFAIDATTGEITVANSDALDFESQPQFVLTVTVRDDDPVPESATASVTINLADINEPPVISEPSITVSLDEHPATGTAVATVNANDVDAGQTLNYAITSGNDNAGFAIDSTSGAITVADSSVLDFETQPQSVLGVIVTDSAAAPLSATATVTINLVDINEAPSFSDANITVSLDENSAAGTAVATVNAIDVDAGQTLSYAITSGNDDGGFTIDTSTGEITVADSSVMNFETQSQFVLDVSVTDNATAPLSATATVTVNLVDINEPPELTGISGYSSSTVRVTGYENSLILVWFDAIDPEGDEFTFQARGSTNNGGYVYPKNLADLAHRITSSGFDFSPMGVDNYTDLFNVIDMDEVNWTPFAGNSGLFSTGFVIGFLPDRDEVGTEAFEIAFEDIHGNESAAVDVDLFIDRVNNAPMINVGGGETLAGDSRRIHTFNNELLGDPYVQKAVDFEGETVSEVLEFPEDFFGEDLEIPLMVSDNEFAGFEFRVVQLTARTTGLAHCAITLPVEGSETEVYDIPDSTEESDSWSKNLPYSDAREIAMGLTVNCPSEASGKLILRISDSGIRGACPPGHPENYPHENFIDITDRTCSRTSEVVLGFTFGGESPL